MPAEINDAYRPSDHHTILEAILSTPLSPENVDSYAVSALNGTVELVQQYLDEYAAQPTIACKTTYENENAAGRYFKLHDIDYVLTSLAQKVDDIAGMDRLIALAPRRNFTLVPPESSKKVFITPGAGSFEPANTTPRLKTTLFVLRNEFGVNVDNSDELQLTKGIIEDTMMRRESYFALHIPKMERTILVCDEIGNVTYVFNTSQLQEMKLDTTQLITMGKHALNNLLATNSDVGSRLQYSEHFVPRLVQAIITPQTMLKDSSSVRAVASNEASYLYPRPPEDVLAFRGIARAFNLSPKKVNTAINALFDSLLPAKYHFEVAGILPGYDPWQQNQIWDKLNSRGAFASPAPEGYEHEYSMSKLFGVGNAVVKRTVQEVIAEEYEANLYRFESGIVSQGYAPAIVAKIHARLLETGRLAAASPEDFVSASYLAKSLGVSHARAIRIIENIQEQLGEVTQYKFGSKVTTAYSPEQAAIITNAIIVHEAAPEGYMTVRQISMSFGVDPSVVKNQATQLGDQISEPVAYLPHKSPRTQRHYSGADVAKIHTALIESGRLVPGMPNGHVALSEFIKQNPITKKTLQQACDDANISPQVYRRLNKTGIPVGRPVLTISSADIEQLKVMFESGAYNRPEKYDKLLKNEDYTYAPEGYTSINKHSKKLGISNNAVERIVRQYSEDVGPVSRYKPRQIEGKASTGAPFWGLSPEQQDFVTNRLKSEGAFLPPPPEGYLHAKAIANELGIAVGTVERVLDNLGDLVSGVPSRVHTTPVLAYKPEDQRLIREQLESKGTFSDPAPEGYLSNRGLAKKLGVSSKLINDVAEEIRDELGPQEQYIFGPRAFLAFSPIQQQTITDHMSATHRLALKAPEEALSFEGLFKTLRVAPRTLRAAIVSLDVDAKLGEWQYFKFRTVSARGFMPKHVAVIRQLIENQSLVS